MFNLDINNFRSFLGQKFEFSRVNILIGENSSGKSSVLKLLLALKQTLENPFESNLKLKGLYTDLGNFEEVIHNNNKRKKIKLGFSFGQDYQLYYLNWLIDTWELNDKELKKIKKNIENNSLTKIEFEFSSQLNNHSKIKTKISNPEIGAIEIVQNSRKTTSPTIPLKTSLKYSFGDESGILEGCEANKDGFLTLHTYELHAQCKKKFGKKYEHYLFKFIYFLLVQNFVDEHISEIQYVNPINSNPKRLYFKEDRKSNYQSIDIEKFINIMTDDNIDEKRHNDRISLLNNKLKEFGIAEEIEIKKEKNIPVIELKVKTKGLWSNIKDVGFGVSLQIPILFQSILSEKYTKSGQTILIEQPEVHLHPKLQAKFIETILSIGPKNKYFIETHSEHIVRKLQLLIKEKKSNLKSTDISIHYFKRVEDKFEISVHKIMEDGTIDNNFPKGFYDTSYELAKKVTLIY